MARAKPTLLKALEAEIPPRTRLLVGVSGGVDSVALLIGLSELAPKLKIKLAVAHLDHGLRRTSLRDRRFVQTLCKKLKVPCYTRRVSLPRKKTNIEAWGRQERYAFFAELRRRHHLDFVVTAHTADDVAETLLMRLLSNKELNSIERMDERRHLLRPLLTVPKSALIDFAEKRKLKWVEDETNLDPSFLRNKVRLKILPLLAAEFGPRVVESLANRAQALAADLATLRKVSEKRVRTVKVRPFGTPAWQKQAQAQLLKAPAGLKWRLAQELLLSKLGFSLGREHAHEVVRVLEGEIPATALPGGLILKRTQKRLILTQLAHRR